MLAEIKGLNEECGIFGIWGHEDAARLTYYGLHSLQHRGQEGAGIVAAHNGSLSGHKGLGLVTDVFQSGTLDALKGAAAIGHVRYSTAGGGGYENVQPLLFRSQTGSMALAHNGNLTNAIELKLALEGQGSIFQTTSDTEVFAHLIRRSQAPTFVGQMKEALSQIEGAFAFLLLTEEALYVALDPHGFRPLSLGRLGSAYVVASETCAFDVIGATYEREVAPGELLIISHEGVRSERFAPRQPRSICSMEYSYLARPDSHVDGINVHTAR
ncbi:amidophosphoribosyltransferase, partial [Geobacillus stearothermophilus]|uniref:amidophosphoribosyltransferase n=1 Tax=Geobacillus stearothermophilus TaxID=1422 RepID=UPI002EC7E282|nr:class II glutamine amidotransferase [Geobacillus stearothermophilus]